MNFFYFTLLLLVKISFLSATCRISILRDMVDPQPILIRPGTSNFVFPDQPLGVIQMEADEDLELFCDGGFTIDTYKNSITVKCSSGSRFEYENERREFKEFVCRKQQNSVFRRTGVNCYGDAALIQIGFKVEERFLSLYDVCFDERIEQTYYVKHRLTRRIGSAQPSNPISRPGWKQDEFFPGRNVDDLYTVTRQQEALTVLLESEELASKITRRGSMFLARGHLAANRDFIFRAHQRATFWFINVAPQWQSFNNGNWVAIEASVRVLATTRNMSFDVYTGTFGIMELANKRGREIEIFLDAIKMRIPAVRFYYKILIDTRSNSGVAIVGINNPFLSKRQIEQDYLICKDVSDRISYIRWKREDIRRGYSYACDVNEFLEAVPHIQGLKVANLLV